MVERVPVRDYKRLRRASRLLDDESPLVHALHRLASSIRITRRVTLADDALIQGWGPITILRSTDDVAALKQGDGGAIFIHGSLELARRLSDADLIDRYNLLVFPVLLGAGKSLFSGSDRDKQRLRLRDSATYSNGVAKLVYDVVR
jgi:dihydrofolate reductase